MQGKLRVHTRMVDFCFRDSSRIGTRLPRLPRTAQDDDATRAGGGPIAELKDLFRKKGAAALPQVSVRACERASVCEICFLLYQRPCYITFCERVEVPR